MTGKMYLGDSVYVELENSMIKLTTDNGMGPSNTIYLELSVYVSLVEYVQAIIERENKNREGELSSHT